MTSDLPRILVIDDQYGRIDPSGYNRERRALCAAADLVDESGDFAGRRPAPENPLAEVVFYRGQSPCAAVRGDVVENDLSGCIERVREGWSARSRGVAPWALVVVDLCFYTGEVTEESELDGAGVPVGRAVDRDPGRYFGFEIVRALRREFGRDLPIAILSGMAREEESVRRSVTDTAVSAFIRRDSRDLRKELRDALWNHGLIEDASGSVVGRSMSLLIALRDARRLANRAIKGKDSILLSGETGTGKELFADYIWKARGGKGTHPFVKVNTAGFSPELFQSELFGHQKGAFTHAHRDRVGRIMEAHGGSLFLDEIQNMPAVVQAGLLRAVESGEVSPVGAEERDTIKVDVRFIAATNADMEQEIAENRFRKDLYERLRAGGSIHLPPLRDRLEDIPLLVSKFLEHERRNDRRLRMSSASDEALQLLAAQDWRGNVRELAHVIRDSAHTYPEADYLAPAHLNLPQKGSGAVSVSSSPISREQEDLNELGRALRAETIPEKDGAIHLQRIALELLLSCAERVRDPRDGSIDWTPAVGLAVPDLPGGRGRTSAAKDCVIRWLKIHKATAKQMIKEDPLLQQLVTWAEKRRKRGKRTGTGQTSP